MGTENETQSSGTAADARGQKSEGGAKPPPAQEAPPANLVSLTSEALKQRLEEERTKGGNRLLKELGYEKADDLKKVLELAKQLENEKLSATERLTKELEEAKKGSDRAKTLEKLAQGLFEEQWSGLPDKVRETIEKAAGDSFDERVRLLGVMKTAGLLGSAAPIENKGTSSAEQPKGKPAPANAGAAPPAPPSGGGVRTKWDEYVALAEKNQAVADIFLQANRFEIDKSRPADT